jgi:hypothetical protein
MTRNHHPDLQSTNQPDTVVPSTPDERNANHGEDTFDEFKTNYIDSAPERVVLDLDMTEYTTKDEAGEKKVSPFIVVRFGNKTMVLNPMAFADAKDSPGYLDVDVHSFIDDRDASCGVFGMSNGGQRASFEKTGQTSVSGRRLTSWCCSWASRARTSPDDRHPRRQPHR